MNVKEQAEKIDNEVARLHGMILELCREAYNELLAYLIVNGYYPENKLVLDGEEDEDVWTGKRCPSGTYEAHLSAIWTDGDFIRVDATLYSEGDFTKKEENDYLDNYDTSDITSIFTQVVNI